MNTYEHIAFTKRWTLSAQTQFHLGECKAMVHVLANTPMHPQFRDSMLKVALVKGAQATTAIEGNTLSEQQVELIQEGYTLPPSQKYLEQEVRNILDAFNALLQTVAVNKHEAPIDLHLLELFHEMIGKDLGSAFDAIPGRTRTDNRVVGPYRPPDHSMVKGMIERLSTWLREEFHYARGQDFSTAVIQAIVTHVYIEWIHPFADGNGRTGRLAEFYILLRAGLPSIVSHILSNFYNLTRQEYYRQLNNARLNNDLSGFIAYAVEGFRDGLAENLRIIQDAQLHVFWQNYIHETMARISYPKKTTLKRQRNLMLQFPPDKDIEIHQIPLLTPEIARDYSMRSPVTLKRDLDQLVHSGLLVRSGKTYRVHIDVLRTLIPLRKS